MTLRDDLKAEAERLGFYIAGITHLAPPATWPTYLRWLELGHHAGMHYLSDSKSMEKRANPARLFAEGKTALCLAIPYCRPRDNSEFKAGLGRVAAYAWGEDYHKVIPSRLEELAHSLEQLSGKAVKFQGFTDSAPVLERDLAQRAGLGWIGKNTCLIHPRLGSFFFLSELIIDLEFEPDPPFNAERCGTCRRCIEACPTGCIQPDRTIDARRCISYLTIENKGAIPAELRPRLGNWVFGCDICQMVCPWNQQSSRAIPDPAFLPRTDIAAPILITDLVLTPEAFHQKFHGSPVQRAKRRGYLRNVAVALGNQPDPDNLPVLADVLANEVEALVRAHAAWAVRQINTPAAARVLDQLRAVESDPLVLGELAA